MSNKKIGVFISIPKCASKTILEMFDLGFNRDNDNDDDINYYIIYENHQRLHILEKKYKLQDKFIFTFVRHPYDRVRSWYSFHRNISFYKDISLNQWIEDGCKTHWEIQNMTNWITENKSPLLQYNFIEGNSNINYIGKIENFEYDCKNIINILNNIFEKENIPKKIHYNYIKKNRSNSDKEILSDKNKDQIYNLFRKDFDYFNYDK